MKIFFLLFAMVALEISWASNFSQFFQSASTSSGAYGSFSRKIFYTSTSYNGNLGGLSGADAKCQARAVAAGFSGTFIALVSTSTVDVKTRFAFPGGVSVFDVKNNLIWQGGLVQYYYSTSGGPSSWIASDLASMPFDNYKNNTGGPTKTYLYNPLIYDEFGATLGAGVRAWTGSLAGGTVAADHCNNWTDGTVGFNGQYGAKNTTDVNWINSNIAACNNTYRLICLQN